MARPPMERQRRAGGMVGAIVLVGSIVLAGSGHAADSGLSNTKVTFTATAPGPAHVKVVGSGTELTLQSLGEWLVFRVPLRSVTTGVAALDRQVRDKYLEIETFPMVELRVARGGFNIPSYNGAATGHADGRLTLHGKTRGTRVHYTIARQGESVTVRAGLRVDLRAFGVDVPRQGGLAMSPEVAVEVGFGTIDRAVVANGGPGE